jgi:hypothetical protein
VSLSFLFVRTSPIQHFLREEKELLVGSLRCTVPFMSLVNDVEIITEGGY